VLPSTRLILNTGSTYLRMALTVGMGLLATRWANREVPGDFALWIALQAAVGVLLVISESVSGSIERFLAFEFGRGESGRLREFFATSLAAMTLAALLALAIGWPLGSVLIHGALRNDPTIDPARAAGDSIRWAYNLVLLGQCVTMLGVPFRAMFIARQSVAWLTIVDTAEAVLRLAAVAGAIVLSRPVAGAAEGPAALLWLCGLTLAAQAAACLGAAAMCLRAYPESRGLFRGCSRRALRELAGFTGWAALGIVSYRIRLSGMPLLLLHGFGQPMMRPFGYAIQLGGYQLNLSSAIGRAAQPAITQAVGARDHHRVVRLIPPINKLATIMASFLLVPLCLETAAILQLWLGTAPDGTPLFPPETPLFVRLMLILMAAPWLYMGYHTAIFADGRIKVYMLSAVLFEAAGLALAALAVLRGGAPAWAVPAIGLCTAMCAMTFWVWHICRTLGLPIRDWITRTWAPVCGVMACGIGAALLPHVLMSEGTPRAAVVTVAYALAAAPAAWFIGLARDEREHFIRILGALRTRLG